MSVKLFGQNDCQAFYMIHFLKSEDHLVYHSLQAPRQTISHVSALRVSYIWDRPWDKSRTFFSETSQDFLPETNRPMQWPKRRILRSISEFVGSLMYKKTKGATKFCGHEIVVNSSAVNDRLYVLALYQIFQYEMFFFCQADSFQSLF